LCFSFELRGGHNLVHDTQTQSGLRVNHIAGIKKLGGLGRPNELRQKVSAAKIRKQAYFRKVLAERRFFGGDANVRGQSEVHSRASCSAVHHGNNRLRHRPHRKHRFHSRPQEQLKVLGLPALPTFVNHGKVTTRTETTPCTGKQHNTNRFVLGNAPESTRKSHY